LAMEPLWEPKGFSHKRSSLAPTKTEIASAA
jgi:hypothetical protein